MIIHCNQNILKQNLNNDDTTLNKPMFEDE